MKIRRNAVFGGAVDPAGPTFFERAMAASLGSFVRPAFQHLSYAAAISYPASLVAARWRRMAMTLHAAASGGTGLLLAERKFDGGRMVLWAHTGKGHLHARGWCIERSVSGAMGSRSEVAEEKEEACCMG